MEDETRGTGDGTGLGMEWNGMEWENCDCGSGIWGRRPDEQGGRGGMGRIKAWSRMRRNRRVE